MKRTIKQAGCVCLAVMLLLTGLVGCGGSASYDYADEIAAYRDMLTCVKSGEELTQPKKKSDKYAAILYDIGQICEPDAMGYALKDINRDGEDELVLMNDAYKPYALLTAKSGKAVLLWSWVYDGRLSRGAIDSYGYVYARENWDIKNEGWCNKVMCIGKNGKLASFDYGSRIVDPDADPVEFDPFVTVGGKTYPVEKMDTAEYLSGDKFFDFAWGHETLTYESGFYYISALGEPREASEGAYEVDFSSYDAILATYRQAIPHLTGGLKDTVEGQFAYDDHTEYETFFSIYTAAKDALSGLRSYHYETKEYVYEEKYRSAYGYALYDVNGDGSDELLLMLDDYTIFALFTLQNGKPELLLSSDMTIDQDGVIRTGRGSVDRYYSDYYLYEIDKNGKLNTKLQFGYLLAEKLFGYRLDGNTFVPIYDREDVWEMYLEHFVRVYPHTRPDIMPTVVTNQRREFTRSVNDLTFVRLDEAFVPEIGTTYYNFRSINPTDDAKLDAYNRLLIETAADGLMIEWNTYDSRNDELVMQVLSGTAHADGDTYVLEADGWRLRLAFIVDGLWMTVEQSGVDAVEPWSYLFDCE